MAFEISTFDAKKPITFIAALVEKNTSPETALAASNLNTTTSPAVQAARGGFAELMIERNDLKAEIVVEGGVSERMAKIRGLNARGKEIIETLGAEALGIPRAQERVLDDSGRIALAAANMEKEFGAVRSLVSEAPAPLPTPGSLHLVKKTTQLS